MTDIVVVQQPVTEVTVTAAVEVPHVHPESAVTSLVADLAAKETPAGAAAKVAVETAARVAAITALNGTYALIGDGASAGANATSALLKEWTQGECYEPTAITRDANEVVTSATVKWPDGSGGTFTATTVNSTWFAVDAFTITHTLSSKTVTQAAVTRDGGGGVTVKPALTVS